MSYSTRLALTAIAAAAASACTMADDVLTSTRDAGTVLADSGTPPLDAGGADASTPLDGSSPDATPVPTTTGTWARLPGHHGGLFRFLGTDGDTSYLMGRNLAAPAMSVYRLDASGAATRLGLSADETGRPFFPPIGELVASGSRLLWATDRDGIMSSDDGGQVWKLLEKPWEDGSVGMGNGHVSRLVDAWDSGGAFCVHREVEPWVDYRVLSDQLYNEVRCLEGDQWSVVTSSIAEGVRFFTAFGRDLYGFTAPLYNLATGAPKSCHSPDLGVTWTCAPTTLDGGVVLRLDSGRLVAPRIVDGGSDTVLWYSDDHGQTWTEGVTIAAILTDYAAVGEVVYGSSLILDEVGPFYAARLSPPSVEVLPRSTRAQVQWLDLFVHDGKLAAADNTSVRRWDPALRRWTELAIESMPAVDVATDADGEVWTVAGSGDARHLRAGESAWDELFFDDSGWASGDVVHHATLSRLAPIGDRMFFGAAHRKLFQVDTRAPVAIPTEDTTLTNVLHPDASLWRMVTHGDELFATATGGEEVNHGTGARSPWGGSIYRRTALGQWTDVGANLPARQADLGRGSAIVPALHVAEGLMVAATHAGVYRSTDGGAVWTAVNGIAAYDAQEEHDSFTGFGDAVLLARARGARTTLYLSTDRGARFAVVASDLPAGLVRALAAEEGVFYALLDPLGVFRSSDQGQTWAPVGMVAEGQTFPERNFTLRVASDRFLVGSQDGVWALVR